MFIIDTSQGEATPREEQGRTAAIKARVSRPKKPVHKPSFKVLGPRQTRPRSAPPGKAAKKAPEQSKPPPFLAFGYRDKEREIGAKKTHNIRASAEVSTKCVFHFHVPLY